MNLRTLNIMAATITLASLPVLSSAADMTPMMQGCMKAFLATLPAHSAKPVKVRFDSDTAHDSFVMQGYDELLLTARDQQSHRMVTQAVCTTDSHGRPILQDVRSP